MQRKTTEYNTLMARRIHRILLVCSNYDSFILEEDGRLDTRIGEEYRELNLNSNPPVLERVETTEQALELVTAGQKYDIVLLMCNATLEDVFPFAGEFKRLSPESSVVLLSSYSKEMYRRIAAADTSSIDYAFCWNNSPELIIAIIKLVEDRMNADHDILQEDVQAILLVEDSIRYYSSYLPMLYRLVLIQNSESIREALNEQQQVMRKRARPKILLATNFDEALSLYEKYRNNLLGVISDVGFILHKGDKPESEKLDAGLDLCRLIKSRTPSMPVLLQSSQESLRSEAASLGVGFVVKNSKILNHEISEYISREFAFGDFVLNDRESGLEIARARDLSGLEKIIMTISDDELERLAATTHMSKWLKARGLFSLSKTFASMSVEQDGSVERHRDALLKVVRDFRISQGLGVVAGFNPDNYDETVWFARIGNGSLGGKARGLAFMNSILLRHDFFDKWEDVRVLVPRTLVLSTDVFDNFISRNGLQYVINSEMSDADILSEFVSSVFDPELIENLRVFIRHTHKPLAVRSSSLLEDSYYQPFAGVYSTYMLPRSDDEDQCLRLLLKAVKSVYASVYFASSRAYITATGNVISQEKMAVVVQEICGSEDSGWYFPTLSGVARSLNFYPIGHENAEDGIVKVAMGLGKAVVDGDQVLRFCPKYPRNVLQTSTMEQTVHDTQQEVCVLDMRPESFRTSVDDSVNIVRLPLQDCPALRNIRHVASTYDYENMRIVDSGMLEGPKYITFAPMLKYNSFPLSKICGELLKVAYEEFKCYVEIEFAADLDKEEGESAVFNVLQVRPISVDSRNAMVDWKDIDCSDPLISSCNALGTGRIEGVRDIIYVKPGSFDVLKTVEIASEISDANRRCRDAKIPYLLVGYGRWGSSQPSLGIPVKWSDISEARVIVESSLGDFKVEPSQGTHFFQNLTSFNVGYINVNPSAAPDASTEVPEVFDVASLDAMPAVEEGRYCRRVHFDRDLEIHIDGRGGRAVVKKG